MKKTPIANIKNAFVVEVDRLTDERGHVQEIFEVNKFISEFWRPAQINTYNSNKNVVRGLHVDCFSKLCVCLKGRIFDVIADVRLGSPTFGNSFGIWLDEYSLKQVFVPSGCAHGFFAAENDTMVLHQQDFTYTPSVQRQIHWRDPTLAISWPEAENYILSEKDQNAPNLE
jgi:dTDP-4-dehydrorhamnose 3,5-epimerase